MRAQCCICADLFVNSNETNIAATPCGHVFHEHCLARWLISSKTCPSCRKKIVESAVIPKLFFDVAEEQPEQEVDPEKLSNELQSLRTQVTELKLEQTKQKEKQKDLKDKLKKKEEELENVGILLQQEQATVAAQKRMLQHFETQQKVHKEDRENLIRAKKKLTEFRHFETLVTGSVSECEELLQQYGGGDRCSTQQLVKYAAILKKEYEQIKTVKKTLREQLDTHKKTSYTATRDLNEMKDSCKWLQEQLSRSEDDLKQAEKANAALKAKVRKLQYGKKHPAQTSGSFLETPKDHNLSNNIFTETPKMSLEGDTSGESFVTPKMTRPSGSSLINLEQDAALDCSFDLFEESPQTQVRKACEENNIKKVKITSASTKAAKRVRTETDDLDTYPLLSLNIMKKRERCGQLLGKTVIRKDYNGFGGTSSFTQPLGPPKFGALKLASKGRKTVKVRKIITNPALPTLDKFIDLT